MTENKDKKVRKVRIGECSRCHQNKELVKAKWCRVCKNAYEKERRANQSKEKKEEINQKERARYLKNKENATDIVVDATKSKKCTVCNKSKTLDKFHLAKNKGKIRAMCKSCSSEKRKEYFQNNREKIIKQTNEYKIEKMKRDPIFKMERRLRCRIYHAFQKKNLKKKEKTMKYLDCTKSFLRKWFEYQFTEDMSFDNYGEYWHIDHVKPCSSYDLSKEEEVGECFCWKNLQPLKGEENLLKSNKVCKKTIKEHQKKVEQFLEYLSDKDQKSTRPGEKGTSSG